MEQTALGLDSVKEYYGQVLQSSQDLKTSACCTTESMPGHLRTILTEDFRRMMTTIALKWAGPWLFVGIRP